MGPSRGGLTTKIHAVVDTNGLPVQLGLTSGEAHDNRLCSVLPHILLHGLNPRTMLPADRGYDADWIRQLISQKGAWANIPLKCSPKEPNCFRPYLYRARNLVERFFNKIKLRSSNVGASRGDMTNSRPIILPLSSSHPSEPAAGQGGHTERSSHFSKRSATIGNPAGLSVSPIAEVARS